VDDKLLTTQEMAAKLDVDPETVRRMCKAGKWPHTKIGRLYRFTESHYQEITAPPAAQQKPRNQRQNIEKLLRSA